MKFSSVTSAATVLPLRTETSVWVALAGFSGVDRLLASDPLQEVTRR